MLVKRNWIPNYIQESFFYYSQQLSEKLTSKIKYVPIAHTMGMEEWTFLRFRDKREDVTCVSGNEKVRFVRS